MTLLINTKARLLAKDLKKKQRLEFFYTYSPIARSTSIRMLITIASNRCSLNVHQIDVKTTFLISWDLDE